MIGPSTTHVCGAADLAAAQKKAVKAPTSASDRSLYVALLKAWAPFNRQSEIMACSWRSSAVLASCTCCRESQFRIKPVE